SRKGPHKAAGPAEEGEGASRPVGRSAQEKGCRGLVFLLQGFGYGPSDILSDGLFCFCVTSRTVESLPSQRSTTFSLQEHVMSFSKSGGIARLAAITFALATLMFRPIFAQTTTGSLSGTVIDQQSAVLPGVSVTATHTDTGTKYEAVTQADGRFQIANVRVGNYSISASIAGFKTVTLTSVVALGTEQIVDFKLPLETVTEVVTVTASVPVIDTTRAGTGSNISREAVETLPTIARSITDVARTNPFFNPTTLGSSGDKALSVAGQHNRYNNIQVDGAVNNDLFGLADSGTPGGQTGTQPISYDAISEIQLVVAPYDVRQGGFAGGGVNIVTRSGTNRFNGTGYYFGQNQGLIGQIPAIATVANPSPA